MQVHLSSVKEMNISELQRYCKLLATLLRHILHVFNTLMATINVFNGRKIYFYILFLFWFYTKLLYF